MIDQLCQLQDVEDRKTIGLFGMKAPKDIINKTKIEDNTVLNAYNTNVASKTCSLPLVAGIT